MQLPQIILLTFVIISVIQTGKANPVRGRSIASSNPTAVAAETTATELTIEDLVTGLAMTNSRAARTDGAWFSGGLKLLKKGKLLNLHKG